jgi:hypothetical protein
LGGLLRWVRGGREERGDGRGERGEGRGERGRGERGEGRREKGSKLTSPTLWAFRLRPSRTQQLQFLSSLPPPHVLFPTTLLPSLLPSLLSTLPSILPRRGYFLIDYSPAFWVYSKPTKEVRLEGEKRRREGPEKEKMEEIGKREGWRREEGKEGRVK